MRPAVNSAIRDPQSGMVRPGYKQTDVGVIPEDWEVSTVGTEFSIQLGKMLDAEKNGRYSTVSPFLRLRKPSPSILV